MVPFGGAAEVARSYLAIHVRNPWTGRCRSCREAYPCRERQEAEAVIGATAPTLKRRLAGVLAACALIGGLLGLIVAMLTAVMRPW